jgi:glycosyltransferase involved in cell wall biosynthesis
MKKKILYIQHDGGLAGATKSLYLLLDDLNKSKYEPKVLFIREGSAINKFKNLDIDLYTKTNIHPFHATEVSGMTFKMFLSQLKNFIPSFFRARNFIKKINPEIIHINTTCLFVFALAAKTIKRKIKVVSHIREPILNNLPGNILRFMVKRFVDEFIAISKYDQDSLRLRKKNNIQIIYNAIDTKRINNHYQKSYELRQNFNVPDNSILALYIARFSYENGTLELLKRAQSLIKNGENIHFLFVGLNKKTMNKRYYDIFMDTYNKFTQNIHLMDFTYDTDRVFKSSDIHVCPFIKPHFSRSTIEASAYSVPTIGSNVGGVNELIIDNFTGLLYEKDSDSDFFNKMGEFLINRKKISVLGANAREDAIARFDLEKNNERIFN